MLKRVMTLEERAYELYKVDWIAENVNAKCAVSTMNEYFDYCNKCREIGDDQEDFESYVWEYGYSNGMIYVCFDEFLDGEYEDEEYMKELLSEADFDLYMNR